MTLPLPDCHGAIANFYGFWKSLRTDDSIPEWDIQVVGRALPSLVPYLMLVEPRGPHDMHVRVAGSGIRGFLGAEMTNRNLIDYTAPHLRAARAERYLNIARHPCGLHNRGHQRDREGVDFQLEGVLLPVRRQGVAGNLGISLHVAIRDEYREPAPGPVEFPLAALAAYFDIGFGVPHAMPSAHEIAQTAAAPASSDRADR